MNNVLDSYIAGLRGKRIAVVGIGISNIPLLEALLKGGCNVTACDRRDREKLGDTADKLESAGAALKLGESYLDEPEFDVVFRTPGLHPMHLDAAKQKGALITSEMELFFKLCPCRTVAVTGSDGKTTTTTIISELLRQAGYSVHLGGNIGAPLLTAIPEMSSDHIAVLELSSFQLHSMYCAPDIAVITNVSPNHLDVHPDMDDYVNAKRSIFRNQTADCRLVLNQDDAYSAAYAADAPSAVSYFSLTESPENGAFYRDGDLYAVRNGISRRILNAAEIKIPGMHNVMNYLAALTAVDGLAADDDFCTVARTFGGVAHRLELIRTLRGVSYYNDSIASSPTRTIAGLRSFEKKPILIAGGYDKHIPFDTLGTEIVKRVKSLFLTGDTADKIYAAVINAPDYESNPLPVRIFSDFTEAVLEAHAAADEGDIVLMSPACASFDKFPNFAKRGDFFREIIAGLE